MHIAAESHTPERHVVAEGDTLYVVRTEQGIELRPGDDAFARAVAAGRDLMKRYPNAMRELAK